MYNKISDNWVLGRDEVYKASSQVWSFKYVEDIVEGINLRLSNMAGGFPFEFAGHHWKDSERLYLCGEFSNDTERHRNIQQRLIDAFSGYAAKRFVKNPNKQDVRSDFLSFRLQWMLFCVWQKCKGNADFRHLLCQIPENVILVENTTTDKGGTAEIWGCKNPELVKARNELANHINESHQNMKRKNLDRLINIETNKLNNIGEWRGQNNIGKILMICRDCLIHGTEPEIDYDLLTHANIYILGERLFA